MTAASAGTCWSGPAADGNRTQHLTFTEVAYLRSVSIKTLRHRIADGPIPAYGCGRRVIRIRVEDLSHSIGPVIARASVDSCNVPTVDRWTARGGVVSRSAVSTTVPDDPSSNASA